MSFESYSLPLEQKIKQKESNGKEKEAKTKKIIEYLEFVLYSVWFVCLSPTPPPLFFIV